MGLLDNSEIKNNITISANMDKLGIQKLNPTIVGGREWFSKWDNGYARSWDSSSNDPYDPEFWTKNKGTGSWKTDGQGTLKISGSGPRMYIVDPSQSKNWHNVEITIYGQRVSDTSISYAGIMAYARTNHFVDANVCDDRGYGGRFTYDGRADFEKETAHHLPNGNSQTVAQYPWGGDMPRNVWIGYKYVVYDLANGNVKLELYMDRTDGLNGGTWNKVVEFIDTGSNFGVGKDACKVGIDPALKLTSSDIRPGSETGKPNLDIYFRSDGINNDGLWYKKASVREITIAPVAKFDIFDVRQGSSNKGVMILRNDAGTFTKDQACIDTCTRLGQTS